MARKSGASRFGRFLDMIGLVDKEPDEELENEFDERPERSSRAGRDDRAASREDSRRREPDARREPDRRSGASDRYGTSRSYDGERRSDGDRWRESSSGRSSATEAGRARFDERSRAAAQNTTRRAYDRDDDATTEGWRSSATSWQSARYAQPERETTPEERDETPRPRPSERPETSDARSQTVIYRLQTFEECREVIIALCDKKIVLVNLDMLDDPLVQRAIDSLGGAAFAIGATMRKASDKTYVIAPSNVVVANYAADARRTTQQRYL